MAWPAEPGKPGFPHSLRVGTRGIKIVKIKEKI